VKLRYHSLLALSLVAATSAHAVTVMPTQKLANGASVSIGLLDMHADGNLDILVGRDSSAADELWLNDGSGSFVKSDQQYSANDSAANSITVKDFDGDGKQDAFFHNHNGASYYRQDGGTLSLVATFDDSAEAWGVGDVNGDGFQDVMGMRNWEAGSMSLYVWYGSASGFASTLLTTAEADLGPFIVDAGADVIGFMDGDGADTVVIGYHMTEQSDGEVLPGGIQILRYDADQGDLSSLGLWRDTDTNINTLDFGDINGDGSTDIVAGDFALHHVYSTLGAEHTIWTSDGNGGYAPGSRRVTAAGNVRLADLDGDGNQDIVVASRSYLKYYAGNGDGTFADMVDLSGCNTYYLNVAVGDLNNDGKLDLVTATTEDMIDEASQADDLIYLQDGVASVCSAAGESADNNTDTSTTEETQTEADTTSDGGSGGGGAASLLLLTALLPLAYRRRRRPARMGTFA
jgi:hypothetical protein